MTSKLDLNSTIKALQKSIEDEEDETITKYLNILVENVDDDDYKHMKILHLIEGRQFSELNEMYNKYSLFEKFPYEFVYSLFIQKKYEKSLESYEKFSKILEKTNPIPSKYLLAQIYYYMGNYSNSAKTYSVLIREHKESSGDIYTNYVASLVLSGASDEAVGREIIEKSEELSNEDNFEFFYNVACAYIELNHIKNASEFLDKSEKLCKQSMKDEDEEDLDKSLTPIKVQSAYINQLLNNITDAQRIYFKILTDRTKGQDASVAVAANNLVSILKGDQSVFEANKRIKVATKFRSKLTRQQQRGVDLNRLLLLIRMKKFDECEQLFKDLEKQFPDTDIPTLLQSSLAYKQKRFVDAIKIMTDFIDGTEKSAKMEISLAQLYINRFEIEKAIKVLEKSFARHELSVVGCLVGIFRKLNRVEDSERIFEESIKYYQNKDDKKMSKILLQNQAEFFFSIGKNQDAIDSYNNVLRLDEKNLELKAGLVIALVDRDLAKAEVIANGLKKVEIGKYGGEKLVRIPVHLVRERKKKAKKIELVDDGANLLLKKKTEKKKRRRKNKKPKKIGGKIDPERWIPKWEREKSRKSEQKRAKRYQGAVAKSAQNELQAKKIMEKKIKKTIQKKRKKKKKRKGKRR